MKRIIWSILVAAACTLSIQAATIPTPTIQAIPANVAGQPGSVVGWGLALDYTATGYWVVLNDSFFTGSQIYGTYNDYIINQFIVAGPSPESSTVNVPFSLGSTGLGEFDILPTSPPGTTITGDITVDYDVFTQDPNSPTFDPGSFVTAGQASAPVSVNITPEPATLGLLIAAGILGFLLRRGNATPSGSSALPS